MGAFPPSLYFFELEFAFVVFYYPLITIQRSFYIVVERYILKQ